MSDKPFYNCFESKVITTQGYYMGWCDHKYLMLEWRNQKLSIKYQYESLHFINTNSRSKKSTTKIKQGYLKKALHTMLCMPKNIINYILTVKNQLDLEIRNSYTIQHYIKSRFLYLNCVNLKKLPPATYFTHNHHSKGKPFTKSTWVLHMTKLVQIQCTMSLRDLTLQINACKIFGYLLAYAITT